MKTRTATLVLENNITLVCSYDYYIEFDGGEMTVVVLERGDVDHYDYLLINRKAVDSEKQAEMEVDYQLRHAIKMVVTDYITIREVK